MKVGEKVGGRFSGWLEAMAPSLAGGRFSILWFAGTLRRLGVSQHVGDPALSWLLWKAWQGCLKEIGLDKRFTVHGLRRTFNDLARRAGADSVVIRSLTGHVTEKMREHYSTVALDEKRQTASDVVQLVGTTPEPKSAAGGSRWSMLEID